VVSNIRIDFGNDNYTIDANLTKDGNQWCILLGPDLQTGVSGYGDTIWQAIAEFRDNVRNS